MSKTELLEGTDKSKLREDCERAKSLQLYPTLCEPMDSSLPGPSVHGILHLRILAWVAISLSGGSV